MTRLHSALVVLLLGGLGGLLACSEDEPTQNPFNPGGSGATGGGSGTGGGGTSGSGGTAGSSGNGGSGGTAGSPGDAGTDADCFTNPRTHFEIINACTKAQRVSKSPALRLLTPDGGLPPL